jgi:hypothetical protein
MGCLAATLLPGAGWPAVQVAAVGMATGWEIAITEPGEYCGFGVPAFALGWVICTVAAAAG